MEAESVAEKYLRLSDKYPEKMADFSRSLRSYCASIIIGREFNQDLDDYFFHNPEKKKAFDDSNEVATELERRVRFLYSTHGIYAIRLSRMIP